MLKLSNQQTNQQTDKAKQYVPAVATADIKRNQNTLENKNLSSNFTETFLTATI